MKISSFNPLIVSKDADSVIKLFEELGFERRHTNANVDDRDITNVTMKDANGFKVDVASADVPQDITMIRMNVDNFEEAYEYFTSKGFVNQSGHVVESKSSKSAFMVSPSGFGFDLCHHIKNHD